jgi:hypothetical protein
VPDLHPTVRHTDELRAAAEVFRDLGYDAIAKSDDPLTVVRNLYRTIDAINNVWPAIARSASFDDADVEANVAFAYDIRRGLKLAVDGLWDASNSI